MQSPPSESTDIAKYMAEVRPAVTPCAETKQPGQDLLFSILMFGSQHAFQCVRTARCASGREFRQRIPDTDDHDPGFIGGLLFFFYLLVRGTSMMERS